MQTGELAPKRTSWQPLGIVQMVIGEVDSPTENFPIGAGMARRMGSGGMGALAMINEVGTLTIHREPLLLPPGIDQT